MKRHFFLKRSMVISAIVLQLFVIASCNHSSKPQKESDEENEKYDGPAERMRQEFEATKDPRLGRVPRERYMTALQKTVDSRLSGVMAVSAYGSWTERGPNSDVVGPSNGNTRPNSGITSGRMRSILVDANDATGNTVFVGGVDGGIWKTTDITASPATWTLVNDFFANMAVTSICQNPSTTNTMYFSTGEWCFNADAVAGDGIFKSTDGGATWSQLGSTTGTNFENCSKIICDNSGNVYVTTRTGVYRSTNGGTSWTTITPSGLSTSRFSDIEISTTGRLHVSAGQFSTCGYRYTDIPATVTSATWTSPTSGYPSSSVRIELGCSGNTLFALPSNVSNQVPTVYKSTDGGANWATTTGSPTSGWAGGQAWYNLGISVDPADPDIVVVGGLESYRSTDGGANWTQLANWVGTSGQYVHADIHFIKIYGTGSQRLLFGSDGGIFFSSNAGTTIRDRNAGLRLKQFYSCAIHPSTTNYFLAGAQDNGSHQLTSPGLGGSVEVTGGDGAFVHIDQDEPLYQYTSYVFNQYRVSTNGGVSWVSRNLNASQGQFINPTDFDDAANIMYCANSAGTYRRWTNPHTGSTSASVAITGLDGNSVTAVKVSPYTADRIYLGTEDDVNNTRICIVDNASTIASGSTGTNISTGLPTNVSTSCIEVGTNDNNLVVTFSNYGVNNIWVTTNGGTSWTNIDGNLPDMPVRWALFKPGDNTKMIIATETGVWFSDLINGASTVWVSSPTFPLVKATMLQYRSSDQMILASTHGRGLWTQPIYSILPLNNFMLRARWSSAGNVELVWDFEESNTGGAFTIEYSSDGQTFQNGGNVATISGRDNYRYQHQPMQTNILYRIKHTSSSGKTLYSNIVKLSGGSYNTSIQITSLYPNPVKSNLTFVFSNAEKGNINYTISNMAGQVVLRKAETLSFVGSNSKTWDIKALSAGSYILTANMGNQKASIKFIKQ
ncbi:MAG TPA: T9SS type A sorting domain-containing protein [Niabella sp.]|jgi:photosystem II stability/assembly factor-like uncharacterized protein|nr:T9SS type A sorting domain-containing protein [Niabella sp.]